MRHADAMKLTAGCKITYADGKKGTVTRVTPRGGILLEVETPEGIVEEWISYASAIDVVGFHDAGDVFSKIADEAKVYIDRFQADLMQRPFARRRAK